MSTAAVFVAAVVRINEEIRPGTWADTIHVTAPDGEILDVIEVTPSEDEQPYLAALKAVGWTVVGAARGGENWTVTR